jgi:N-glycosylase/DNA lyase
VTRAFIPVCNYDLTATLASGQAFRWREHAGAWEGVIGHRWVRLQARREGIAAEAAAAVPDWRWLEHYLQTDVDLNAVLATFPADPPMRDAAGACRGLRLLRQDPWECLASFILSSTKQIIQIQQIIELLCARFGDPVAAPEDRGPVHGFPAAERLARCSEGELRACKMGFRAPSLLAAARAVAEGAVALPKLASLTLEEARRELLTLRGVGDKIANCVLLFAGGFPTAFPVDVWVMKALRELYFPGRRVTPKRLREFATSYFGPHAGYAQQYLFHQIRTRPRPRKPPAMPGARSRRLTAAAG